MNPSMGLGGDCPAADAPRKQGSAWAFSLRAYAAKARARKATVAQRPATIASGIPGGPIENRLAAGEGSR